MGWASTEQAFGTAQLVSEKVNLITRVIVRNYFIVLLYQSIFLSRCVLILLSIGLLTARPISLLVAVARG